LKYFFDIKYLSCNTNSAYEYQDIAVFYDIRRRPIRAIDYSLYVQSADIIEKFTGKSGFGFNEEIYIRTPFINILILPIDYEWMALEYRPKAYPRHLYVNVLPYIYPLRLGYFDL